MKPTQSILPYIRRSVAGLFVVVTLALALNSCADNDGPTEAQAPVMNIVTYDGYGTFSFQVLDDSPLISLRPKPMPSGSEDLQVGQRYLMRYYPADGDINLSGDVELLGLYLITTADVTIANMADFSWWDASPVYLTSIWRSGQYINIRCDLPYNTDKRDFGLLADEATLTNDVPSLYLVHRTTGTDRFDRTYYISFDISKLKEVAPQASSYNIHINNSNQTQDTFQISAPQ